MSKKKGLSLEEKRTKLLELFTETTEVYQLKELEKIAPKTKGIISQSVKDVLMSLVNDGLVDSEKIGTSTYFWSFPSKLYNAKKVRLEELKQKVLDEHKKLKRLDAEVKELESGEDDEEARLQLLEKLKGKQAKRDKLKSELDKLKDMDPTKIEEMKEMKETCSEAVNRWTDNVFAIRSWIKEKKSIDESEVNKAFGIPEDFDYLD